MEKESIQNPGTEKVDFDNFAGKYEMILDKQLDFFGEENSYFAEYKVKLVKDTLSHSPKKILEFGCGIGRNLKYFTKYFPEAEVYGADISAKSLEIAKSENPSVNLFLLEDEEIKKHSGRFDHVFISCVFHHIAPELRKDSMEKIFSMMSKNSSAYIFEHNPYNPVTRHIVNTCEWDTDAILLNMKESESLMKNTGLEVTEKNYTLFFPAALKFLRFTENFLKKIPMGGQYYVKAVKR
ncbi:MAG: methyltransferase domain-containing protein [Bacteroidetes bacterium]|nr:methyltransferase domain-containing protein [Bacteroidota bacterium]